ncbi:hypothetical protein [uncultured Schumannella sp.]|uniref:hypothetical protein n=1 Tax=uncultured Schumannella sp. TaxID=1195956 RepID=UPI0025D3DA6E|nr:hypothetical protein [uncultured Schumannella sp.]
MRRIVPVLALGAGLSLALSGCFANPLESITEGLVENGVEELIEGQTGVDIDVNGSGVSLPDSWPSELPLPDGELLFSIAAGGTYSAQFEVSDDSAFLNLGAQLQSAGYELVSEADFGGLLSAGYENDTYFITLSYVPGEGDTGNGLQYGISEKESE